MTFFVEKSMWCLRSAATKCAIRGSHGCSGSNTIDFKPKERVYGRMCALLSFSGGRKRMLSVSPREASRGYLKEHKKYGYIYGIVFYWNIIEL